MASSTSWQNVVLRWTRLKEREIFPFVGTVPFLCACIAPIPVRSLWKFLHTLIVILIQFNFFLFIYSLQFLLETSPLSSIHSSWTNWTSKLQVKCSVPALTFATVFFDLYDSQYKGYLSFCH